MPVPIHPQGFGLAPRFGRLTALGLIAASVPALASAPPAQALAALHKVIGPAACDSDGQCRTVAIGNRACGGPDAYLAWSVRQTDPAALQQAAARYNAAQATAQPPGARISTCEFVSDPGAGISVANSFPLP